MSNEVARFVSKLVYRNQRVLMALVVAVLVVMHLFPFSLVRSGQQQQQQQQPVAQLPPNTPRPAFPVDLGDGSLLRALFQSSGDGDGPVSAATNKKMKAVRTSLARPLCIVVVMGTEVVLGETASLVVDSDGAGTTALPNCMVHIAASNDHDNIQPTVLPRPPPHAFIHHRFFLVSDLYDAVTPIVAAKESPLSPIVPLPPVPVNITKLPPWHFPPAGDDLDVLRPRLPLRATTFFQSIERNRMAAVVINPRTHEDIAALQDVLVRFPPRLTKGFLETIVVQQCGERIVSMNNKDAITETLGDKLVDILTGQKKYGQYTVLSRSISAASSCSHVVLFLGTVAPEVYPVYPSLYTTSSYYGRTTNQIFADSIIVQTMPTFNLTAPKGHPIDVGYLVPERFLHYGGGPFLYDLDWIHSAYGPSLMNRVLSVTDFVAIENVGWCPPFNTARCFNLDNMVTLDESSASLGCISRLHLHERSKAWDADGTRALRSHHEVFTHVCTKRPLIKNLTNTSEFNVVTPGSNIDTRSIFSWLTPMIPFSPIIRELADRQMQVYYQQLRSFWNTPVDITKAQDFNIIGVHMRLTDYDSSVEQTAWMHAIGNTTLKLHEMNRTVHGLLICTDDVNNAKYRAVMEGWPGIPKLMCANDIALDKGGVAFQVGTIQSVLAESTCFIGFATSSFAHRINDLRDSGQRRRADCDYVVRGVPANH